MKNLSFVAILLLLCCWACADDDEQPQIDALLPFLGDYQIENVHISQVHPRYDSVGNVVDYGVDTNLILDSQLSIYQQGHTDTLRINGLIKSFNASNGNRTEVQGVVDNDTIRIVHDLSTFQLRNNFIRGNIWRTGDSIFLDYRWDRSDIWSAEALPEKGQVTGRGI